MVDEMSKDTLLMDELLFQEGTAHIDTLNYECLGKFDSNDELMVIDVYRTKADLEAGKLLGRIYRPGHAEYYRDCGEITWKYLRKLNEYNMDDEPSGDGVRIP